MDESTGHTIVHYLYTKSFEALATMGDSANIGFTQALLVYIATAECSSLEGLQAAAVHEMEGHGSLLSIFEILSATDSYFSKLARESWVHDYLPRRAREAFEEDHGIFKTEAFLESVGGAELYRFMMTCAIDLYDDKISRMTDAETELKQRLVLHNGLVQDEPVEDDVLEQSVKDQEHFTSTQHDTFSSDDFCTISCPSSGCPVNVTLEETVSVEECSVPDLSVMLDPESVPVIDPYPGLSKSKRRKLEIKLRREAAAKAIEDERLHTETEECFASDASIPKPPIDAAILDPGNVHAEDPFAGFTDLQREIQTHLIAEAVTKAIERERLRVEEE